MYIFLVFMIAAYWKTFAHILCFIEMKSTISMNNL